ncbi:MAG: J domain-containing protein [Deltaproteobacteria bacterium]|nr:J domain-containing protein [Deltaproteobacteria bacterium]
MRKASELLGLGEKASLAEIKKAYRRLSKKHHPDVKKNSKQKAENVEMHRLAEAYQTLLRYCADYRFPLIPGKDEQLEGEDWWFERFGQDHHWGKGSVPKGEKE